MDFFKDPRKREILHAVRQKSKDVSRLVTEKAFPRMMQEVDSVNQQQEADKIMEQMEKDLAEAKLNHSSSNVPASVPSAPTA